MLDFENEILTDTVCRVCGYNLRGLKPSSVCPECAVSVISSLERLAAKSRRHPLHATWSLIAVCGGCAMLASLLTFQLIFQSHFVLDGPATIPILVLNYSSYAVCFGSFGLAFYCVIALITSVIRRDSRSTKIVLFTLLIAVYSALRIFTIGLAGI